MSASILWITASLRIVEHKFLRKITRIVQSKRRQMRAKSIRFTQRVSNVVSTEAHRSLSLLNALVRIFQRVSGSYVGYFRESSIGETINRWRSYTIVEISESSYRIISLFFFSSSLAILAKMKMKMKTKSKSWPRLRLLLKIQEQVCCTAEYWRTWRKNRLGYLTSFSLVSREI